MTYKELKECCDKKIKDYPQYEKMYRREIILAKHYYDNGRNLYEELTTKPIKNKYVIPFLLGITNEVDEGPLKTCFVNTSSSGGIDVDSDFESSGKERIQNYLFEKYGRDRVLHVGTYLRLGQASAAKDLLRVYKVDFKQSNSFTRILNNSLTWEENLNNIKENFPEQWKFYLDNKEILDLTPYFINKIRNISKHAGVVKIVGETYLEKNKTSVENI